MAAHFLLEEAVEDEGGAKKTFCKAERWKEEGGLRTEVFFMRGDMTGMEKRIKLPGASTLIIVELPNMVVLS